MTKLKQAIKYGKYSKAGGGKRNINILADEKSASSGSSMSRLVRVASYDVVEQNASYSSTETDMARARSFTSEEDRTRHARLCITIHDNTDSESISNHPNHHLLDLRQARDPPSAEAGPSREPSVTGTSMEPSESSATYVTSPSDLDSGVYQRQIQKKGSLFGPIMSCLFPSLPEERVGGMPSSNAVGSPSHHQLATMRGLNSEVDALDKVFNNVETFVCREDEGGLLKVDDLRESKILPGSRVDTKIVKLKSDEDALDKVFNNLETLVCRDDEGTPGARFDTKMVKNDEKDIIDYVFVSVENGMCHDDTNILEQGQKNNYAAGTTKKPPASSSIRGGDPSGDNKALVGYKNDMLDNVFEEVEKVACRYQNNGKLASSHKDILDSVFEGVENVACRDEEEPIQRGDDPPARNSSRSTRSAIAKKSKGVSSTTARNNGDMLDRVFQNFEHTVCHDPNQVAYSNDTDMLDHVCESIENTACGATDPSLNSSRTSVDGDAQAPIDLTSCGTYSMEPNNSMIAESPSVDNRSEKCVIGLERRTAIEERRVGTSSSTKKKSHSKQLKKVQQKNDMLDYVFENVESAVCRPDDDETQHKGFSRVEKVRAAHKEASRFSKAREMRRIYNYEEPVSQRRVYWKEHE